MQTSIEITVPVLDEESTLSRQIHTIRSYLDLNFPPELGSIAIVIADNGSRDATPDIARQLERELTNVKYLRLEERGVGRALKLSWGQSTAQIVGYMDLDLATDLRHLRPALEMLLSDEADITTGSRLSGGSRVVGRSPLRTVTSHVFNLIVKTIFRTSFSDGMCGFKFLKRSIFHSLEASGADSNGWFFATEILICGEHLGFRVRDIPVEWTDDPNSKVKIAKLTLEYLKAMLILRRRLKSQTPR